MSASTSNADAALDSWVGRWLKDADDRTLGFVHGHASGVLLVRFPDENSDRIIAFGRGEGRDRLDPADAAARYRTASEAELQRPQRLAAARKLGGDVEPQMLTLSGTVEASSRLREPLYRFCDKAAAALDSAVCGTLAKLPAGMQCRFDTQTEVIEVGFSGRRPTQGPPSSRFELRVQSDLHFFASPRLAELLACQLAERLERLLAGPLVRLAADAGEGAPARLDLVGVRAELSEQGLRLDVPRLASSRNSRTLLPLSAAAS